MSTRSSSMRPNSNFVSARISPRRSASVDANLYSSRLASRSFFASSSPTSFLSWSKVMFSSWPLSAFVAGERAAPVLERRREVGHHARHQVVLLKRMRLGKPVDGELRQDLASVRDAVRQDVVEGGDAVRRHHQQPVCSQLVRVANLAPREELERKVGLSDRRPSYQVILTPKPMRS